MRRRGYLPILLAASIGLAASGCAVDDDHDGHGEEPSGSPGAANARVIQVTGDDFAFDPERIELTAGEEVALELTAADVEHDLVVEDVDAHAHVHAGPGETATGMLRIDEPGTYTAYCSIPGHREAGMTATVDVTD